MSASTESVPKPREQRARELAYREENGLEVGLYYHPTDQSLSVSVLDTRAGEALQFPVRSKAERDLGIIALEAFRHPFAYAALYGEDTGRFDARERHAA